MCAHAAVNAHSRSRKCHSVTYILASYNKIIIIIIMMMMMMMMMMTMMTIAFLVWVEV